MIKCIRECVHFSLGSIRLSFASFHFVIRLWQLRLRRWSSGSISRPRYALVRFGGGRVSRPKAATTPTPANGNRWWQTEASGCRQRGGEKGRLWRLREKCALFLFWNHSFFSYFFSNLHALISAETAEGMGQQPGTLRRAPLWSRAEGSAACPNTGWLLMLRHLQRDWGVGLRRWILIKPTVKGNFLLAHFATRKSYSPKAWYVGSQKGAH